MPAAWIVLVVALWVVVVVLAVLVLGLMRRLEQLEGRLRDPRGSTARDDTSSH